MKRATLGTEGELSATEALGAHPGKLAFFHCLDDVFARKDNKDSVQCREYQLLKDSDLYDFSDYTTRSLLRRHMPLCDNPIWTTEAKDDRVLRIALDDDCASPVIQKQMMKDVKDHLMRCLNEESAISLNDSSS